jgi:hypothetical protein
MTRCAEVSICGLPLAPTLRQLLDKGGTYCPQVKQQGVLTDVYTKYRRASRGTTTIEPNLHFLFLLLVL